MEPLFGAPAVPAIKLADGLEDQQGGASPSEKKAFDGKVTYIEDAVELEPRRAGATDTPRPLARILSA